MTHQEFETAVNTLLTNCKKLLLTKGHDYSAASDRLVNFKRTAKVMSLYTGKNMTSYEAALFFQLVKIDRLNNLLNATGKPKHESMYDTIIDELNYLMLKYACLIDEGRM